MILPDFFPPFVDPDAAVEVHKQSQANSPTGEKFTQ